MPEPMTGVLRSDVELIRGEMPMLFDRQSDAYFKIDRNMVDVIGLLTESMPLDEFLEKINRLGFPVSREELMAVIGFLQANNLMEPEYGQIGTQREQMKQVKEKTAFLRFSAAYLFFKLPPWRPEKFFGKIGPYVSWMASRPVILLLLAPALLGYLLVVRDFGAVRTTLIDSLSWAGLAKYLAAIILLKFVHEAAHALAAIHFHCRVRGIGLGFMVFYPRLYTDTTDSWRLPRSKRLLIDAAGIIIELLLGGIAALLWTYLPPGVWKSTMFYVFAVSTISTLFVNGNPCIRYDGYYILCDLVNIENLMSRSSDYVRQFWRWHFLRLGSRPHHERGVFLLVFGVVSFIYRIFLYTSIILVIYHNFVKALAVVMMILELYSIMIYPFWREVQAVRALSKRSGNRAVWYLGALTLAVSALVLFLPLSWSISLPGEVQPAERQLVTVLESGYLKHELPRRAFPVKKGTPLLSLSSAPLEYSRERMVHTLKYDRLLLAMQQLDEKSFADSLVTGEKIRSDLVGLDELTRRRNDLTLIAGCDGIFVPMVPDMSPGAYFGRGQMVGEVVSAGQVVHAYAQDRDVGRIQVGDQAEVCFPDALSGVSATVTAVHPIAARLKNSPLLQHFGGPIPVYMDEGKVEMYSSVLALYRVDLSFSKASDVLSGRTVKVKIRHTERLWTRFSQFVISIFRREF